MSPATSEDSNLKTNIRQNLIQCRNNTHLRFTKFLRTLLPILHIIFYYNLQLLDMYSLQKLNNEVDQKLF